MYTKFITETIHHIHKFYIKIYLQSFVSYLSFIWNHLKKYFLQIEYHIKLLVHL